MAVPGGVGINGMVAWKRYSSAGGLCVTNMAAGVGAEKLEHTEVLENGARVQETLTALLSAVIPRLACCA